MAVSSARCCSAIPPTAPGISTSFARDHRSNACATTSCSGATSQPAWPREHECALASPADRAHDLPLLRRGLRRVGAAGRIRRCRDHGRSRPSRQFRPHLLQGLRARRDARPRRTSAPSHAAAGRRQPCARRLVGCSRPGCRRLPTHRHAPRLRCNRLLSLRPTSDRGLLRRQQADERIHRLGERGHQFAPVHGLLGCRPQTRLRRRHRARQLRRPRPGRPSRPRRLEYRMVANKRKRGAKIVVIDPRRTATAEDADLYLAIAPGMDTVLFCGLLAHLADLCALDYGYIDAHTMAFENTLAQARAIAPDLVATARLTRLPQADVARFFDLFRSTPNTVTCFSQGVNQSAQGTDKVNAIINCHLATGRIGRRGQGPFSLTGQPNAMGGREVGGLANQLAAHMAFTSEDIDRVRRFWNAPRVAAREGAKAVQMFDAIARGRIKALWVMATNPAVSLPRASHVREALKKLDLFVVSENVLANDTVNAGAHILLPASAWGEKEGTVTNSERRISRQRRFLPLPGEAQPDWWMVTQVARRMGHAEEFAYESAADIFREHAALSTFENGGARDFDLGALSRISDDSFDGLVPVLWPCREGETTGDMRFFASGGFFTSDHKARFVVPEVPALRGAATNEFPFVLNTGRVRDQWHTMTRT